jgi:hypothetical protein
MELEWFFIRLPSRSIDGAEHDVAHMFAEDHHFGSHSFSRRKLN